MPLKTAQVSDEKLQDDTARTLLYKKPERDYKPFHPECGATIPALPSAHLPKGNEEDESEIAQAIENQMVGPQGLGP